MNFIKMESLAVRLSQQSAAKFIVSFSKIKKEQTFLLWQHEAKRSKEKKSKQIKVDEEKMIALRRIVRRNYLKIFV